jgi:hypothetical protein
MERILEFSDFVNEKKKKGLWANIHAKRKRGERPAKKGDKDYPSDAALKAARESANEDHEVSMSGAQLDDIIKNATELRSKIGNIEMDIPAWCQDHISQAQNFISQANIGFNEK